MSQQHNTYFTTAGHICNSGLWFCITLLMVHSLGWALKRAKHCYVELNLGKSVNDSTVLGLSSCIPYVQKSKIRRVKIRGHFCKMQSKASKENANIPPCDQNPWTSLLRHRDVSLVRAYDDPSTQCPSWTALTTSDCTSLNIRPSSTGTKSPCSKKGCICVKKEALLTRVKDFASHEGGHKKTE